MYVIELTLWQGGHVNIFPLKVIWIFLNFKESCSPLPNAVLPFHPTCTAALHTHLHCEEQARWLTQVTCLPVVTLPVLAEHSAFFGNTTLTMPKRWNYSCKAWKRKKDQLYFAIFLKEVGDERRDTFIDLHKAASIPWNWSRELLRLSAEEAMNPCQLWVPTAPCTCG